MDSDVAAIGRIDAVPMILDVVCRATGMGFAAVARVTEDRWIACRVRDDIDFGLKPGGELPIETTICDEIRVSRTAVIIGHVAEDVRFRDHHTPARYGFQSYISMPIIRADGSFFGTLCAIDPRPAVLDTPETVGMFKLFAELIAFHLDVLDKVATSQADLVGERETAALRERFIAVLGHDLRNPLAAIEGGVGMLGREPLGEKGARIVDLMRQSVGRMSHLVETMLDLARGRLGGGLPLDREYRQPLQSVLGQVIAELRVADTSRSILTEIDLPIAFDCDSVRLSQLFSNLIANALTHGAPGEPVRVTARARDGHFEFGVANAGEAIPPTTMKQLFQPFSRGREGASRGLGLGLYIASEIAKAHGGTLTASSTEVETRFVFTMPIA
jgi:signal transduction histidine kinase